MPVIAHFHQWTHTTGGLQCSIPPCTAFMTGPTLQGNGTVNTGGNNGSRHDGQNDFNNAWKKSGGG